MGWERDEWKAAYDANDDMLMRRFAGGIEIVGDKSDAADDERVADRNTDDEKGAGDGD